jgi:hypothetical protein
VQEINYTIPLSVNTHREDQLRWGASETCKVDDEVEMANLLKNDLTASIQLMTSEKALSAFSNPILQQFFQRQSSSLNSVANNTPLDSAGNTLASARIISVGTTSTSYQDFVGSTDTNDYYRFTLTDTRNLALTLSGLSADADVQLLNSSGAVLQSSALGGTSSESISRQLTAGTYYIRVFPYSGSTNYTLSLFATPDLAGNSLTAARVITIGSTATTYQDFVGSSDTNDYYRFSLSNTQNFSLSLAGLSANADVQLLNSTGGVIRASTVSRRHLLHSSLSK